MSLRRPPRIPGFPYVGPYRYSLCFVTNNRAVLFCTHGIVGAALREIQRTLVEDDFALLAYCFMPDHVHLKRTIRSAARCIGQKLEHAEAGLTRRA